MNLQSFGSYRFILSSAKHYFIFHKMRRCNCKRIHKTNDFNFCLLGTYAMTLRHSRKFCILSWRSHITRIKMRISNFNFCLKGLSDSRSGGVFCERYYNEGLKVGVFSYFISRYKCCGPN